MATWMRVVHDHPDLAHRKGERVRRRGGRVVYEITGTMHIDETYLSTYGFVHKYPVLRRLTHGTKSRPEGSTTAVGDHELRYNFEEAK